MHIFPISSRTWCAGASLLALAAAGLGLAGCSQTRDLPNKLVTFEFQTMDPQAGKELTMPMSGLQYRYIQETQLTEVDVSDIEISQINGVPCLVFTFDSEGQKILYRETALHQGLLLFTMVTSKNSAGQMVEDTPIGAMRITEPLGEGTFTTYVEIPPEQLPGYVQELQDSIKKLQALRH